MLEPTVYVDRSDIRQGALADVTATADELVALVDHDVAGTVRCDAWCYTDRPAQDQGRRLYRSGLSLHWRRMRDSNPRGLLTQPAFHSGISDSGVSADLR
jgi:hypothetical protein